MKAKERNILIISDQYETGLLYNNGKISMNNIAGGNNELIEEFNKWVAESHTLLEPFRYTVSMIRFLSPELGELKRHNIRGFELAKRIKATIKTDYRVHYSCINYELV